jgi:hypothetical protein
MATITSFQSGNVSNEGKVNWRGDQLAAPQGGQSIFESSSVPLAELGTRKVVGDRVFRYAQAGATINAGDVAIYGAANIINVTAGGTSPAGGKQFTWYSATGIVADYWAEGYVYAQSGTAANMGYMYRIKSHPASTVTTNVTLELYDPLVLTLNVTDKYSIVQNPYKGLTQSTAATGVPMGVAPIVVTTGDYFWLQTYGPVDVKCSAVAAVGDPVCNAATGQVAALATTDGAGNPIIGMAMQICTNSERGLVFLQIAP